MTVIPRSAYDEHWKHYQSAGPVNWRAAHHRQPDEAFVALCDAAEQRGLRVTLDVSATTARCPNGDEFRLLGPILLSSGSSSVIVNVGFGATLTQAAIKAREGLGKL